MAETVEIPVAVSSTALNSTGVSSVGHRKERVGEVVSDKMQKTIIVEVRRRFQHPEFKKVVSSSNTFCAHDEHGIAKNGDLVRIEETRPLSKTKRWRLVEILNPDGTSRAKPAA